jgi:hypothetical protein
MKPWKPITRPKNGSLPITLKQTATGVVNIDDAWGRRLAGELKGQNGDDVWDFNRRRNTNCQSRMFMGRLGG